jgi:hypothetical protein
LKRVGSLKKNLVVNEAILKLLNYIRSLFFCGYIKIYSFYFNYRHQLIGSVALSMCFKMRY